MVKRLINALDSVTTSLLRSKVSFEEASEFSTPRLTVNLKSFTVSDAGGEVRVGFANFKLPEGSNMFRKGMPGLTSVNQKVSSVNHLLGNRMMMMMTSIMTFMLLFVMMIMTTTNLGWWTIEDLRKIRKEEFLSPFGLSVIIY